MRLPKMTTRRWIVAVAAIGLVILMIGGVVVLKQRRDYFLTLVQSHQNEVDSSTARGKALKSRFEGTSEMTTEEIMRLYRDYDRMMTRAEHHASLARKYERAARYPWLPVERDPPEPENPVNLENVHNVDVPGLP
jgi:hypothetical protein